MRSWPSGSASTPARSAGGSRRRGPRSSPVAPRGPSRHATTRRSPHGTGWRSPRSPMRRGSSSMRDGGRRAEPSSRRRPRRPRDRRGAGCPIPCDRRAGSPGDPRRIARARRAPAAVVEGRPRHARRRPRGRSESRVRPPRPLRGDLRRAMVRRCPRARRRDARAVRRPGRRLLRHGRGLEALVVRPRSLQDGATPSGNAMAAAVLLRLAAWTGDRGYREAAERTARARRPAGGSLPDGVPAVARSRWISRRRASTRSPSSGNRPTRTPSRSSTWRSRPSGRGRWSPPPPTREGAWSHSCRPASHWTAAPPRSSAGTSPAASRSPSRRRSPRSSPPVREIAGGAGSRGVLTS